MNKFIPSFFQCILLGIVILATACQSEKLPNGTFVRQDATPETFIGLEVKDDTLIWKQDAGKLSGKHFIYSISNNQLEGKCIETGERMIRTFQKDTSGFLLGGIRFSSCPDITDSISDGNYIQYNAVPKNTVHIIIKGDSITKIQTHYDQPLHIISAQYTLDDKQCLIHVQLSERKQSFVFRPCPDGFILDDWRFVKEQ